MADIGRSGCTTKLHTAERRMVWLAREDHRTSLADFVTLSGLLIEVVPVETLTDVDGRHIAPSPDLPTTFRRIDCAASVPVMSDVLVLIDIQRDYFPGGRMPLVGPDDAADQAASLLSAFRKQGLPVIHVRHESLEPDAEFLVPGTSGAELDPRVAPHAGETVIVKHHPNAFLGTDLQSALEAHTGARLVVAGMMTSMCVDATVRAASDLGHTLTVVADACAAPDLEFAGTHVEGRAVHAAFICALGDAYADVLMTSDVVG